MEELLDEPAVVLLLLSLAAALLIVEVALPTAGIAGTMAIILGVGTIVAIDQQDAEWWPLVGPCLAVTLWGVMVARRRRSTAQEAAALGLYAAGGVWFGVLADSPMSVVVAIVLTGALAVGFPLVHGAAVRLLDRPAQVGMESLDGTTGVVSTWEGTKGTVRVQGSLWTATSAVPLTVGDEVTVSGHTGMTITVAPRVRPTS
jgi:membrane-bound ClpP family serine protease